MYAKINVSLSLYIYIYIKIRDYTNIMLDIKSHVWHSGCSSSGNLGSVKQLSIAITPSSTLTRSGNTCYGPIYMSNRSV